MLRATPDAGHGTGLWSPKSPKEALPWGAVLAGDGDLKMLCSLSREGVSERDLKGHIAVGVGNRVPSRGLTGIVKGWWWHCWGARPTSGDASCHLSVRCAAEWQ